MATNKRTYPNDYFALYNDEDRLAIEEDIELYVPILSSLKAQYQEGVYALKTGNLASPKKDVRIAQEGAK